MLQPPPPPVQQFPNTFVASTQVPHLLPQRPPPLPVQVVPPPPLQATSLPTPQTPTPLQTPQTPLPPQTPMTPQALRVPALSTQVTSFQPQAPNTLPHSGPLYSATPNTLRPAN